MSLNGKSSRSYEYHGIMGHFEGLNEGFLGSSFSMIDKGTI
jgi:hypothetical protein